MQLEGKKKKTQKHGLCHVWDSSLEFFFIYFNNRLLF